MELNLIAKGASGASTVQLSETIFDVPYKESLIHDAVVKTLADWRQGTSKTKSRSEVRGGGKKPWRQKGTGRARAGSIRSPLWRTGGHSMSIRPRSYKQKMNKKAFQLAFKSVLSELIRQNRLHVVESLDVAEPKTKVLVKQLQELGFDRDVLLVVGDTNVDLMLAARNIPTVGLAEVEDIDPVDLIAFKNVVFTVAGIKKLEERLS